MRAMAAKVARRVPIDVELVGVSGDQVPFDSASVDTVVITYTLCSIPEPEVTLPKETLEKYQLGRGDRIYIEETERGIVLTPWEPVFMSLYGTASATITATAATRLITG